MIKKYLLGLRSMWLYGLTCVLFSWMAIGMSRDRVGGDAGDKIETKMSVKTIRENPGSFRSHYARTFIYVGGK